MFYKADDIHALFNLLNGYDINYILTKNIADELPFKLRRGKDIDLIVHPKDYEKFQALLQHFGYKRIVHPHGRERGWNFIYGAHENIFMINPQTDLIVDAYAELCTKSIAMNAWLPLDKVIQKSVWADKVWDAVNQWWIMDDENMIVYLLTRSIFEKNGFTAEYIHEIEKRKYLLTGSTARQKLEKIFFKFTDTLIETVRGGYIWRNSPVVPHIYRLLTAVKNLGEVLKIVKETKIGGGKFLIELNEPLVNGGPRVIHIQNDKFRMEMSESDFLQIAGATAFARKKFDDMKGWGKK